MSHSHQAAITSPAANSVRRLGEDELALLDEFIAEAMEHVESAEAAALKLESCVSDDVSINTLFRAFHTIKGGAGFLDLAQIAEVAHAAEGALELGRQGQLELTGAAMDLVLEAADRIRSLVRGLDAVHRDGYLPSDDPTAGELVSRLKNIAQSDKREPNATAHAGSSDSLSPDPQAFSEAAVRITTQRLDSLMDLVGELVVAELMVREVVHERPTDDPVPTRRLAHLGKITREIYDLSVTMRMVPIHPTFQKLARVARDLGRKCGKEIELKVTGGETELDRKLVEAISDPLMHMVRNAIDHGVELSDERLALGKSRVGVVALNARHEGGEILIEISDDGRGLDRDAILAKAWDAGLVTRDQLLSDAEVWELIFHPGLSTAALVTEVSGRGVGMDVVKRNIEALRGRVEIQSVPGRGTVFRVRLPLTLAVIDALAVGVGTERYLVPITSIEESLQPQAGQLVSAPGALEMCLLRGRPLPLVRLGELFGVKDCGVDPSAAIVVVVRDGPQRCCVMVDELLGQQQVLIKPLGSAIGTMPGIAGGTVMGDGRIALVLDIRGIVQLAGVRRAAAPRPQGVSS